MLAGYFLFNLFPILIICVKATNWKLYPCFGTQTPANLSAPLFIRSQITNMPIPTRNFRERRTHSAPLKIGNIWGIQFVFHNCVIVSGIVSISLFLFVCYFVACYRLCDMGCDIVPLGLRNRMRRGKGVQIGKTRQLRGIKVKRRLAVEWFRRVFFAGNWEEIEQTYEFIVARWSNGTGAAPSNGKYHVFSLAFVCANRLLAVVGNSTDFSIDQTFPSNLRLWFRVCVCVCGRGRTGIHPHAFGTLPQ